MATTSEIYRDKANSGYSDFDNVSTYNGYADSPGCFIGIEEAGGTTYDYMSYLHFATSGLVPAGNSLTKVELYFNCSATPYDESSPGFVTNWAMNIYMGEFISGWADPAAMWTAGTLALEYDWASTPQDEYIDLGAAGIAMFNNDGDTDFRIERNMTPSTVGSFEYAIINMDNGLVIARRCKLRYTYDVTPADTGKNKRKAGYGKVFWMP